MRDITNILLCVFLLCGCGDGRYEKAYRSINSGKCDESFNDAVRELMAIVDSGDTRPAGLLVDLYAYGFCNLTPDLNMVEKYIRVEEERDGIRFSNYDFAISLFKGQGGKRNVCMSFVFMKKSVDEGHDGALKFIEINKDAYSKCDGFARKPGSE